MFSLFHVCPFVCQDVCGHEVEIEVLRNRLDQANKSVKVGNYNTKVAILESESFLYKHFMSFKLKLNNDIFHAVI